MKALVTGGGGFLGRRIVELLLERGDTVSFLARGRYPDVEALGATGLQVDLRDRDALTRAVEGVDVVYHVAAKPPPWGPPAEYQAINVDGTRNLLDAMESAGVPRLVYTSSPSVCSVSAGIENGGPDLPYPERHESDYSRTKAEAEQMVLRANSRHLATVAVRPHLIFGPRDDKLLPKVIERAASGRLRRIGDGTNRVDLTYVDNAAWAHLDAERALTDHEAPCAGRAYFISNDEPVVLWDWIDDLLEQVGAAPVQKRISYPAALRGASVAEWVWRTFGLRGEPPITRQVVSGLATAHWYDMAPARRDLGYHARIGMADATGATVRWLNEHLARTDT